MLYCCIVFTVNYLSVVSVQCCEIHCQLFKVALNYWTLCNHLHCEEFMHRLPALIPPLCVAVDGLFLLIDVFTVWPYLLKFAPLFCRCYISRCSYGNKSLMSSVPAIWTPAMSVFSRLHIFSSGHPDFKSTGAAQNFKTCCGKWLDLISFIVWFIAPVWNHLHSFLYSFIQILHLKV